MSSNSCPGRMDIKRTVQCTQKRNKHTTNNNATVVKEKRTNSKVLQRLFTNACNAAILTWCAALSKRFTPVSSMASRSQFSSVESAPHRFDAGDRHPGWMAQRQETDPAPQAEMFPICLPFHNTRVPSRTNKGLLRIRFT